MVSNLEEWQEGKTERKQHEEDKADKEDKEEEEELGLSDHRLIWGTYRESIQRDAVRKIVDWGDAGLEDERYNSLQGDTAYDKLKALRM